MIMLRIKAFVAVGAAVLVAGCSSAGAVPASPAAGLIAQLMKIEGIVRYTALTDPNHLLGRQAEYTSKASWGRYAHDTASGGGSIEVFPTVANAQARFAYLKAFQPPIGDGYDYVTGTAILRLSSDYTPAQAQGLHGSFNHAVSK
jgi:hypothetical protein